MRRVEMLGDHHIRPECTSRDPRRIHMSEDSEPFRYPGKARRQDPVQSSSRIGVCGELDEHIIAKALVEEYPKGFNDEFLALHGEGARRLRRLLQ